MVIPRLETEEMLELLELQKKVDALGNYLLERFAGADKDVVSREWMQRAVEEFNHPEKAGGQAEVADVFPRFMAARRPKISPARYYRYGAVQEALRHWCQYRGGRLLVDAVTEEDLRDFEVFLADEWRIAKQKRYEGNYEGEAPEPRSQNTLNEYLGVLRAFYHWAGKQGLTTNNPFARFRISESLYGTPYYLTLEEVETLYRADLRARPRLAVQRDIFVFQCQVGCRVGDLCRFRAGDAEGGVLEYIPGKTKDVHPRTVRVPLNERAKEILARYEDEAFPRLLPFIATQKYNDAIKDALRLAGITRSVTVLDPLTRREVKRPINEVASSHLARRTFIGNLYRVVKDPNIIASMSGHAEGSRAFARYRDIDDEVKTEIVGLLDGEKKDG